LTDGWSLTWRMARPRHLSTHCRRRAKGLRLFSKSWMGE
jgi:hypothetical protein